MFPHGRRTITVRLHGRRRRSDSHHSSSRSRGAVLPDRVQSHDCPAPGGGPAGSAAPHPECQADTEAPAAARTKAPKLLRPRSPPPWAASQRDAPFPRLRRGPRTARATPSQGCLARRCCDAHEQEWSGPRPRRLAPGTAGQSGPTPKGCDGRGTCGGSRRTAEIRPKILTAETAVQLKPPEIRRSGPTTWSFRTRE